MVAQLKTFQGESQMSLKRILGITSALALATTACGDDTKSETTPDNTSGAECRTGGAVGSLNEVVDGDITSDTCWSNDTVYVLNPKIDGTYVKVKEGATLTIQPGTTIKGNQGSALV